MRSDASEKRRVLLMCVAGYTVSYLLRTNLSAVLDKLMAELQITKVMAGSIGTLFFGVYALGQIGAGYLAERVNPKRMAALGLLLSAMCNLWVGLAQDFTLILVLWGVNGLSLAMVWSPMFKILTNWFDAEEYRRVSVVISLPTTVGYLLSWGGLRAVAQVLPWRTAFFLPAALTVLFLCAWVLLLKPAPRLAEPEQDALPPRRNRLPLSELLLGCGLLLVGLCAIVQGLIKEGINLWGPTLLSELGGSMASGLVAAFSVLIPVCGTVGIFCVNWLVKRLRENDAKALFLLFAAAGVASLGVYALRAWFAPSVLLLSTLMACMCGANVLITVLIPMRFAKHHVSTQVAGGLNFLCYIGAGLGGSAFGLVSDLWGWQSVYLFWIILSFLAVLFTALWIRRAR